MCESFFVLKYKLKRYEQKKQGRDCDSRAAQKLGKGVSLHLYTRNENEYCQKHADCGRNIEPEVDKHCDGANDSAGVPACFKVKELVEYGNKNSRKKIIEIYKDHSIGSVKDKCKRATDYISCYGEYHSQTPLAISSFILIIRNKSLHRICENWKNSDEKYTEDSVYPIKL